MIAITPLHDESEHSECTPKAVVTTLSREKRRSTAFVLAEDLSTGEVLRCDVILDVIDKLGVLTTTRELYLEEAPETFELWAQDSQGNAFTSLEGVEFNWKITSQNRVDGKETDDWQQVLRFLRFSESKYHDVPQSVAKFDQLGQRGYMVLLEGINTGSAKVTVALPYTEYSHVVSPIDVNIMVLANIILDPSDVNILVGDTISFKILQLKQGKLQDITHNTQYYLEVENKKLATLRGNRVTGNALGRTSVVLKDRNVAENIQTSSSDIPIISASLTVTRADKITVNLLPHYNWLTVEGERHSIGVDLYTHDNQLITLGNGYSVNTEFDANIFYQLSKTDNGTRVFGETLRPGTSAVVGTFEKLVAKGELHVYKRIDLRPARVVLPFDPNHPRRQRIQYTATGGDGSFIWSSLNTNLVGIAQSGLAETKPITQSEQIGGSEFAQVKVALQRNPKISKTADILFLQPSKLKIVRYNFETAVRDFVFVQIALYAEHNGELLPFTSCESLNFEYKFADEIFHIDANVKLPQPENLHAEACHLLPLRANSIGTSHFRVSYTTTDRALYDEVDLVVFDKLEIVEPLENEIVLPIGSSRNIIYENGPQRVFSVDAEITKSAVIQQPAIATAVEVKSDGDKHVFQILCRKVGTTTLTFEVYNSINAPNHWPYVSRFVTNVFCVKPRFINLYTTAKLRESCPLKVRNSLMHVKQDEDQLEVGIEVLDAQQRKLQNISSLVLTWHFSNADNPNYDDKVDHHQRHEDGEVGGVKVPRRDYLALAVPDIRNSFKIRVTVDSYNKQVLKKHGIVAESPEFGVPKSGQALHKPVIENEISFLAVNSTLLPYDRLSIFLAPNHVERVRLAQGSGFYDLRISDDTIADIVYNEEAHEIVIQPLRIGQAQIELTDRCLMTEPSRFYLSVVSIGRIEVKMPDRVERLKSIEAIVRVYDSLDSLLSVDQKNLQIYELRDTVFNPHLLSVAPGDQNNLNVGEIRYSITGLELGETKVMFTSGHSENSVNSAAVPIQVSPK